VHKELLDTIRAVHAGKKTLSADVSYALAEHATDDALTQGELEVLRLIAGGNARASSRPAGRALDASAHASRRRRLRRTG
jgi:hypothetical protein